MTTNIREGLDALATAIEKIEARPIPKPQFMDREISGNKIMGGKIAKFASTGIKDNATYAEKEVLVVENDKIVVPAIETARVLNPLSVEGDLSVAGTIHAERLNVNEISADIRNERTAPLEFKATDGSIANKGLVWTGQGNTRQLTMQVQPERLFSSESIDVARDKEFMIGGTTVLSSDALGLGIRHSALRTVGPLEKLRVTGKLNVDDYLIYDPESERLGLGTEEPAGALSIQSFDHQFVIDPTEDFQFKLGTWTTSGLEIITDDTPRISIKQDGTITMHNKVVFSSKIGVGVKNFSDDVDITTNGPIRFQNKKQEVGSTAPTSGNYRKGDICWNDDPKPTGFVGWICVRDGTPGEWRAFGAISK